MQAARLSVAGPRLMRLLTGWQLSGLGLQGLFLVCCLLLQVMGWQTSLAGGGAAQRCPTIKPRYV
jgi:hypothetical protein